MSYCFPSLLSTPRLSKCSKWLSYLHIIQISHLSVNVLFPCLATHSAVLAARGIQLTNHRATPKHLQYSTAFVILHSNSACLFAYTFSFLFKATFVNHLEFHGEPNTQHLLAICALYPASCKPHSSGTCPICTPPTSTSHGLCRL